jgi:hypothetical protein
MAIEVGALRQMIGYEQEEATSNGADVLDAVRRLRHDLDEIEKSVESGLRVPSSVTSDPFVASTARELVRAIIKRQATYDLIGRLDYIAKQASS